MKPKGKNIMATPIKPTPVLGKKEAVEFLKKVEENLGKPSRRIDTPKLSQAKKLAVRHVKLQSKSH